MADTVDVPVVGKIKNQWVWAGGALVTGVVAYAWWRKKNSTPTDFVGASPDDFGATDYNSPLGNSGTNSTGDFSTGTGDIITTNGQWTTKAVDLLASYGWDASTVATALGKYLARKGLTEDEITIVNAARAAVGDPPVGGPYPVTVALPPPPSTGGGDNPPPNNNDYPHYFLVTGHVTVSDITRWLRDRGYHGQWYDVWMANQGVWTDDTVNAHAPEGTMLHIP